MICLLFFFFQAEDGIRDIGVTGVQTCALPICLFRDARRAGLSRARAVAVAARAGGLADGADLSPPSPQPGSGQGVDRAAGLGAATLADRLPRRLGVRRDRLPAVL